MKHVRPPETFPLPIDNAEAFIQTMVTIWDDDPLGLYDKWHDAKRVAQAIGATRAHPRFHAESGYCWDLPNGDRVWIASHGGAIHRVKRHTPKEP